MSLLPGKMNANELSEVTQEDLIQKAIAILHDINKDVQSISISDLQDFMKKNGLSPILSVADPAELLEIYQNQHGHDIWIPVKKVEDYLFHIGNLGSRVWKHAQRIAQCKSSKIILVNGTGDGQSEKGKNMLIRASKVLKEHVNNRTELTSVLDNVFVECDKDRSDEEVFTKAIQPLINDAYIKISGEGVDAKIMYNMPTNFGLLCIQLIERAYQDKIQALVESRKPEENMTPETNIITTLVSSMNEHLQKLRESDLLLDKLECAVDVLHKSKPVFKPSHLELSMNVGYKQKLPGFENVEATESSQPTPGYHGWYQHANRSVKTHGNTDELPDLQTALAAICKTMSGLTMDAIHEIPCAYLTPEAMYSLLTLQKMGSSKPKTLVGLCRALKAANNFCYVASPFSLKQLVSEEVGKDAKDQEQLAMHVDEKHGSPCFDTVLDSLTIKLATQVEQENCPLTPSVLFNIDDGSKTPSAAPRTETGRKRPYQSRFGPPYQSRFGNQPVRRPLAPREKKKVLKMTSHKCNQADIIVVQYLKKCWQETSALPTRAPESDKEECFRQLATLIQSLQQVRSDGDTNMSSSVDDVQALPTKEELIRRIFQTCVIQRTLNLDSVIELLIKNKVLHQEAGDEPGNVRVCERLQCCQSEPLPLQRPSLFLPVLFPCLFKGNVSEEMTYSAGDLNSAGEFLEYLREIRRLDYNYSMKAKRQCLLL